MLEYVRAFLDLKCARLFFTKYKNMSLVWKAFMIMESYTNGWERKGLGGRGHPYTYHEQFYHRASHSCSLFENQVGSNNNTYYILGTLQSTL